MTTYNLPSYIRLTFKKIWQMQKLSLFTANLPRYGNTFDLLDNLIKIFFKESSLCNYLLFCLVCYLSFVYLFVLCCFYLYFFGGFCLFLFFFVICFLFIQFALFVFSHLFCFHLRVCVYIILINKLDMFFVQLFIFLS
jgi:hypothetical protein